MRLLSSLFLLTLLCTACDQPQPEPKVEQEDLSDKKISLAPRTETEESEEDQILTQKIKLALFNDILLSRPAKGIDVKTFNGTVVLEGKVHSERERNLIAAKVRQINGVTGIENNLQVEEKPGG